MAHFICDICRQPIPSGQQPALKLWLADVEQLQDGNVRNFTAYTHYMHVGECCKAKVMRLGWSPRRTKEGYDGHRRKHAMEKGNRSAKSAPAGAKKRASSRIKEATSVGEIVAIQAGQRDIQLPDGDQEDGQRKLLHFRSGVQRSDTAGAHGSDEPPAGDAS